MKILLLGNGGREHALAWKISQSAHCEKLYIASGNAGTIQHGENIEIDVNDFGLLETFCQQKFIEMVIVGSEAPLVKGITDFFAGNAYLRHIYIIGPGMAGAQLEGSKAYAKDFMKRHNIPTAAYKEFTAQTFYDGLEYINHHQV
jgi:phosphoribosylamine--glycine ligase